MIYDKITISGAQGTGKSTLITAIEDRIANNPSWEAFKDHVLIKEIVRTLVLKGIKINKGADHNSQVAILNQHYLNTLVHDEFISDRCSLDAYVYSLWDYINGNYTYEQHKIHQKMFEDSLKKYSLMFYIPVEFELVDDGFRNTEVDYQKEIDSLFNKVIFDYNLEVINLSGSVEERISQIEDALGIAVPF